MGYKSVYIKEFGSPDVLEVREHHVLPEPKRDEVRVKVHATSAAYTDTLIRKGMYPDVSKKPPFVLGYDLVGSVDMLGEDVTNLKIGQLVAELTTIGAYTEYILLPARRLTLVPPGIDHAEGVSLVLTYVTAYQMLKRCAKVKAGDSILIHGAGGAVGRALVQIGNLLNLNMYGTAATSHHNDLESLGCTAIDYRSDDFVMKILESEKTGVQAVFDAVGGENYKRSLRVLHKEGRLVAYGSYNATSKLSLISDFLKVHYWNLTPWNPNCSFYSIGAWHEKHHDWFKEDLGVLFQWLRKGELEPSISKRMRLEDAADAHELIEKGGLAGKIVLETSIHA